MGKQWKIDENWLWSRVFAWKTMKIHENGLWSRGSPSGQILAFWRPLVFLLFPYFSLFCALPRMHINSQIMCIRGMVLVCYFHFWTNLDNRHVGEALQIYMPHLHTICMSIFKTYMQVYQDCSSSGSAKLLGHLSQCTQPTCQ